MKDEVPIIIIDHAKEAMEDRGATQTEVLRTVRAGEAIPAKKKRTCHIKNFSFDGMWRGKHYRTKQLQVIVADAGDELRVVTVITKYFGEE